MKQSESELKQALQSRDDFLSIASHELKTPLTSLNLQVQLLCKILFDSKTLLKEKMLLKTLEICTKEISRMTLLMDRLMDLTKIRTAQLDLSIRYVDLGILTKNLIEKIKIKNENRVPIVFCSHPHIIGNWDPFRLEQILENLLSNAIKYGNLKPIVVELEKSADTQNAIIRVRDEGIGILPSLQRKIFERFERLDRLCSAFTKWNFYIAGRRPYPFASMI